MTSGGKLAGQSGPASVNWVNKSRQFSYQGQEVIKLSDPENGTDETVFNPKNLQFEHNGQAFNNASFQWSKDSRFIVFRTNINPMWRNSGYADYYLFSLAEKN